MTGPAELWVCNLQTIEYRAALALQERVRAARQQNLIADTLLLLEHPPVYTRGRRSDARELPMGEQWYRSQGIDIVDTDRGGKLTYHGPGQLVGYPIMRIDDVIAYLRTMEQAIVAALGEAGLPTHARPDDGPDFTGVWTQANRKIASIGVHVARGVTTHGFAINVQNDLQPFDWVVACGLDEVQMTSVIRETGAASETLPLPAVRASMTARFAEAFELSPRAVDLPALLAELDGMPSTAAVDPPRPVAGR
ncbi:MAG TPA: lipoyl(octanoyl) transferase LipB [Solirubrobacteraceae bacterium]|nr:lipoyl(octanoyl) transferase LipB [Solirubrobacteraceae bacterium]